MSSISSRETLRRRLRREGRSARDVEPTLLASATATYLDSFIDVERKRYHDDFFASSLWQAFRYLAFLAYVEDRYEAVSAEVYALMEREEKRGKVKITKAIRAEIELQDELINQAHMEVETYYLFAKIALDKIAHFVEDYFGQARHVSLRSHGNWKKHFARYCESKRLVTPDGMLDRITLLERDIAEFRAKSIAHLQHPRVFRGTSVYPGTGLIGIVFAVRKVRECEQVPTSPPSVSAVGQLLDAYVHDLVALIEANRDKSRFTPATADSERGVIPLTLRLVL